MFLATILTGCDLEDEKNDFFYEFVPVESVDIPDQFTRGDTVPITTFYFRPTDCHSFGGFDYDRSNNERTVTIVNVVLENRNCNDLDPTDLLEVSFDFNVGTEESYIFKFWQGRNEQGENQFLEIEVPVVD